jgi:hypothetical protein
VAAGRAFYVPLEPLGGGFDLGEGQGHGFWEPNSDRAEKPRNLTTGKVHRNPRH